VLGRWYDAGLGVPADLTSEVIRGDEIGRLTNQLITVVAAGSIPGRMDDREEQLLDKRRSRRVSHALRQALLGWAGSLPELEAGDDTWRLAAQLDWQDFRQQHATDLHRRARLVATWAIRNEHERWGKSAIVLYENELGWMEYAFRE
jgi:hypothetical protein